jgi:anti-anti-sigma factor
MLRIDIHAVHPNVTLCCSGRIVLGLEAETLRCMATSRTENHLTLDLSGIGAIDAAGLGLLVELQCWANDRNKTLRIVEPSAWVRKLIALTNLQCFLQVASREDLGGPEACDRATSGTNAERAMSA